MLQLKLKKKSRKNCRNKKEKIKTIQELDREKLDAKFSKKKKN